MFVFVSNPSQFSFSLIVTVTIAINLQLFFLLTSIVIFFFALKLIIAAATAACQNTKLRRRFCVLAASHIITTHIGLMPFAGNSCDNGGRQRFVGEDERPRRERGGAEG